MPKMSSDPRRPASAPPCTARPWARAGLPAWTPTTTVDLEALRQDLAAAVQQVDAQMSPWKPDSDLVRLNRAPVDTWVDLPAEMLEVLDLRAGHPPPERWRV
jgi:thiamine biosynthesis lipoprotein